MRDCIFLVADSTIQAMLKGFLGREGCHFSLGCAPFQFDAARDVIVDPTRDPGVYTRGHELLSVFTKTHRRAIVILDADWEGSPGADVIRSKIEDNLRSVWSEYMVVVLDPEIEAWIWQDNHHVVTALGAENYATLRQDIEAKGFWSPGAIKPHRPKEAVEFALKRAKIPQSAALYGRIAGKVSIAACEDLALRHLKEGLMRWFEPTA